MWLTVCTPFIVGRSVFEGVRLPLRSRSLTGTGDAFAELGTSIGWLIEQSNILQLLITCAPCPPLTWLELR